jgi:hypothetical protein
VFDGFLAVLFAQTALLHTAERQFVVDDLCGVDPGISSLDSLGSGHSPINVAGPNGGTQTEDRIIGLLYGLVKILDSNNGESRAEALLLQESRGRVDIRHQCRL